MTFESKSFEINHVKFYDRDLFNKMKSIECKISDVFNLYEDTLDVNKNLKIEIEKIIKERLNVIENLLNEIKNHSLIYEDDSDEYYRGQVFDEVSSVLGKIFEQELENDNALGLPFKEYNLFYWNMNKIENFFKKMENMIEL